MPRILVVEDEVALQALIGRILDREGYEVVLAGRARKALRLLSEHEPDLAILDYHLSGGPGGSDLALWLWAQRPDLPILFISGSLVEGEVEALGPRAGFLMKPFDFEALVERVGQMIQARPS